MDFFDRDVWIAEKIRNEVEYLKGIKDWKNDTDEAGIIERLSQLPKLEDASFADLLCGFKRLIIEVNRLKNELQAMLTESKEFDRPLKPKERRALLTIITALCKLAKVNYEERGTAKVIELESERMGTPVSDETVRKYFALIQKYIKIKFDK